MPHKTKPELLWQFFQQLRVTQGASNDCDNYDLHSENEASREHWKKLLREQAKEAKALIQLIQLSGDDILEEMKVLEQ